MGLSYSSFSTDISIFRVLMWLGRIRKKCSMEAALISRVNAKRIAIGPYCGAIIDLFFAHKDAIDVKGQRSMEGKPKGCRPEDHVKDHVGLRLESTITIDWERAPEDRRNG